MISVVMPAYNSEKFIEPAIDSILNQTYKDFEFIIVDDGSTDSTLKIIEDSAQEDNRIKVVHGKHEGVSAALNQGIAVSTRDWIAIMHSDDVALPNRLERQLENAQADPEVVIWGTDGYHINSKDRIVSQFRVGPTSKEECQQWRTEGKTVQAMHPSVMFNKAVYEKAGRYNSQFDGCEDVELFDRMMQYGALVTIPEHLLKYRLHTSSLVMQKYLSLARSVRYVKARQLLRQTSNELLSWEEFLLEDRQRSLRTRFKQFRQNVGGLYYRQAGIAYAEKQYLLMAYYALVAFSLRPLYNLKRVWTQLLSPVAKGALKLQRQTDASPSKS